MEIKDIAGLSEPLKKLLEVVSEGIGGISRPILTRKNADAKAYEIMTIAKAIADSQKLLGPVQYKDGVIVVESSTNQTLIPDAEPEKRVLTRIAYQEVKKQLNIENVTRQAAEELNTDEKVSDEKPDSDWTTRFFRIAEDVTTEQMQMLWGKVLAGEVKKPGSYSLRTLEVLKNISRKEADVFVKASKITITSGDKCIIPNPDNGAYLETVFGLTFVDFLVLREIGLLVMNDLEFSLYPAKDDIRTVFTCGNTCILMDRPKGTPKQGITAIVFTAIGRQLLQLIDKAPADPEYIKKFASFFRHPGCTIKSGSIIEWLPNQIKYDKVEDVPI